MEATGLDESTNTASITKSFQELCKFACFEAETIPEPQNGEIVRTEIESDLRGNGATDTQPVGIGLSYTINLNLPETSDIAVFNAIFKSLKENLLRRS